MVVIYSLSQRVKTLPSASFAFVMATGIVSTALDLVGQSLLSVLLLGIAIAGGVVLVIATMWRLGSFRAAVADDIHDPSRAFGFFTIVAAINVVGIRLYSAEAPVVTIVLGLVSVPIWLLLTYGVPAELMLRAHRISVAGRVDGSWFLWVVGTQSLSIACAVVGQSLHTEVLAEVATGLWGVGVMLYLMLTTLVTLRLLTFSSNPRTLHPSYWIYMGATAITVLAGSQILALPADLPLVAATATVVSGLTYVLWAFGLWWVPLLLVFGIWRHRIHHEPLRYESGFWSIVFPLGMYSVASIHFGDQAALPALVVIGQVGTWIAALAWLAAAVAMAGAAWPIFASTRYAEHRGS